MRYEDIRRPCTQIVYSSDQTFLRGARLVQCLHEAGMYKNGREYSNIIPAAQVISLRPLSLNIVRDYSSLEFRTCFKALVIESLTYPHTKEPKAKKRHSR